MAESDPPRPLNPMVHQILDRAAANSGGAATESSAALRNSLAGQSLKPVRHGGLGRNAEQFASEVYDLAIADASLAWLAAVFNTSAHDVATLQDDGLWEGRPNALITTGHHGEGALVDGRLTGRWRLVVGAEYAEWFLLSVDIGSACRVLIPRDGARIEPIGEHFGLGAAGICDVAVSELTVEPRRVLRGARPSMVVAAASAAAAVVGSADGLWRAHVEQARARLAASHGGDETTDVAAAQLGWSASDIDAAKLQITTVVAAPGNPEDVAWASQQAVARARSAADRLLDHSRHALNASDPVTRRWQDVHAGCRLAVRLMDAKSSPLR
ncbi:MAG: hypothetical protein U1C73_00205 [Dietzia sp.]|nr:hypothetical protein [Dietzia sp.]